MVVLTEVEDEHFQQNPAAEFDDDDFSDTGTSTPSSEQKCFGGLQEGLVVSHEQFC